ncbi:MAG TPA: hypothetical protein VG347_17025 [Verrucomicrobiae bacterium]|nr:hypothetical protein [Verrucomicrobiae bacterium]
MYHDYKYSVEFRKPQKILDPVTDLSWGELIAIVSQYGPMEVEAIRFHHPGAPHGKSKISGKIMLFLWQELNKKNSISDMGKSIKND